MNEEKIEKQKIYGIIIFCAITASVIFCAVYFYWQRNYDKNIFGDIEQDIKNSNFIIVESIWNPYRNDNVHIATMGCVSRTCTCGYPGYYPCYFIQYNFHENKDRWLPRILGKYYSESDKIIIPLTKIIDPDTIELKTSLFIDSENTRYFTKHLDIRTGEVRVINSRIEHLIDVGGP